MTEFRLQSAQPFLINKFLLIIRVESRNQDQITSKKFTELSITL